MGVFNKKSLIYSFYIILASRANVAGIAPFGPAAYAIALMSYDMSYGYGNLFILVSSFILGILTVGIWHQAVISSVAIILFTIGLYFLRISEKQDYPFILKSAILLVFSVITPMIIYISSTDSTIMDVINLSVQSAVTFIMFFVYRITESSLSDFIDNNLTSYKPTQEELACFAISIVVAFLGFPKIVVFGLSIRNIISIIVIMTISLRGGFGTGAAAGVMIGLITNSSSAFIITYFSFCGFLSGLLNKFKKIGVISAFVIGNVILAALLGATKDIIHAMYETGFASVVFAVLPVKIYDFIKIPIFEENAVHKRQISDDKVLPSRYDYAGKIRNAAMKKARFYSDTMNEMSEEFLDIISKGDDKKKEDSCLIRVINKVCHDCKFYHNCWEKEYKIREKSVKQCEKIIDKNGEKTTEIISILGEFCIKPDAVIDELRIGIEIRRIEKICMAKINECKSMVVKQFGEMGKISSKIADEIKQSTSYNVGLEKRIIDLLKRNEIYAYDVVAVTDKNNKPNISVYIRRSCNKEIINKIVKLISEELSTSMQLLSVNGENKKNGVKELKLFVKPDMEVSFGCASIAKEGNNISGDSYNFINHDDGFSYAILSDGMGTGRGAAEQSESVVKIIELYINSGVNILSAISTINMLLSTKSNEVNTASIDICKINKHSKTAEFIKMGAMPSLIVGKTNIKTVEINRPPVGISADIEDLSSKICEYDISDEVAVVMFTDGIYDAFNDAGINKRVFYEYLANITRKYINVEGGEEIAANEIVNKAAEINRKSDDMSVFIINLRFT